MGGITRTIHPTANFAWKPLRELAPDLNIDTNVDDPPMGLMLVDPDGEVNLYVFTEDGRKKLLEALTGGIVMPGMNGGSSPLL